MGYQNGADAGLSEKRSGGGLQLHTMHCDSAAQVNEVVTQAAGRGSLGNATQADPERTVHKVTCSSDPFTENAQIREAMQAVAGWGRPGLGAAGAGGGLGGRDGKGLAFPSGR